MYKTPAQLWEIQRMQREAERAAKREAERAARRAVRHAKTEQAAQAQCRE